MLVEVGPSLTVNSENVLNVEVGYTKYGGRVRLLYLKGDPQPYRVSEDGYQRLKESQGA